MASTTPAPRLSMAPAGASFARDETDGLLQHDAQAQLALNELFPHLRAASDAALRDIFVSLRLPAQPRAAA